MRGLKYLVKKTMKTNKKETISIILAIILSSLMLFTIGFSLSSVRQSILDNIIYRNGNQHVKFKEIKYENVSKIKTQDVLKITKLMKIDEQLIKDNFDEDINLNIIGADSNFFQEITLKEGNIPKNADEIIISNKLAKKLKLKLNDKANLKINEVFKEYKVVGIYSDDYYLCYLENQFGDYCNNIYILKNKYNNDDLVTFNLYFKKINSSTFDKMKDIAKSLRLKDISDMFDHVKFVNMDINLEYLSLFGVSFNYGLMAVMIIISMILMTTIGIACFFIIYNSIAIAINERKKIYGILSSIGATKNQIFKSVFYETIILSIIGITIGFIISLGLTNTLIYILNNVLKSIIEIELSVSIYPLFLIISFMFILATIFLSTLFPASRASEVTPIEAIRQHKDIKIKKEKLKSNKLLTKIFGFENLIARKNMKRNKSKYRITTISLFISIVLFITVSSVLNVIITNINIVLDDGIDFDISINTILNKNQSQEFLNNLYNLENITKISSSTINSYRIKENLNKYYNQKFINALEIYNRESPNLYKYNEIFIYTLDRRSYDQLKKQIKLKDDQPVLINYSNLIIEKILDNGQTNITKLYKGQKFLKDSKFDINLCSDEVIKTDNNLEINEGECNYLLENIFITDKIPFSLKSQINNTDIIIIPYDLILNIPPSVGDQLYQNWGYNGKRFNIYIKAKNYFKINNEIDNIIDNMQLNPNNIFYQNYSLELHEYKQTLLSIKIIIYTFVLFFAIISITSVFNTITANIKLRQKEFAVLRSVGLSPEGFNKIIFYESLVFSIKSILFALPVVYLNIYFFTKVMNLNYDKFPHPTKYILFSIIGVFIVVFITMRYASKKIQFNNIIDSLKEHN